MGGTFAGVLLDDFESRERRASGEVGD